MKPDIRRRNRHYKKRRGGYRIDVDDEENNDIENNKNDGKNNPSKNENPSIEKNEYENEYKNLRFFFYIQEKTQYLYLVFLFC